LTANLLLFTLLAQTQAAPAPAARSSAESEPVTAIIGGDVWTVTKGVIKGGTVLIRGKKIEKVGGPDVKVPEGAMVIDAKGHVVAPGFVTAQTIGGLVRGGSGRLRDALDPYSLPIQVALASGVTTAYVVGGGPAAAGPGAGEGGESASSALGTNNAIIKMSEADISGMLVKEPAHATISLSGGGGGGGRFGGFRGGGGGGGGGSLSARYNLRERLRIAREYQDKFTAYEADKKAGKQVTEPRKPTGVDDYLALVKKERVLRVTASEVSDMRWALRLVDDFGIKLVMSPATEAWIIADEIAKRDACLILTARSRVSADDRKNGPSGASTEAAAILKKAGVKFALVPPSAGFSTGGQLGRDLITYPLEAAFAIRGGLDEQTALESLTIEPARILGVDDRVGSIEEGKDADILILNGDPLDYRTFAERVYVNGKLLYEREKSTFFDYVKLRGAE
jgi:imidazolonepropionase-like amidohydrolase